MDKATQNRVFISTAQKEFSMENLDITQNDSNISLDEDNTKKTKAHKESAPGMELFISHRKSSSRSRKKNSFLRKIIKRNKRMIAIILAFLLVFAVFYIRGTIIRRIENEKKHQEALELSQNSVSQTSKVLKVEFTYFTKEVTTVSDAIADYMQADVSVTAKQIAKEHSNDGVLYAQKPLEISYNLVNTPTGCIVNSAKLEISEYYDFSESVKYDFNITKKTVKVNNLKTNTNYYYRITINFTNDTFSAHTGSFKTTQNPRILSVDGIANVRDIGGFKGLNGKYVKQGLLFRGTELDGVVEPDYKITEKGIATMLSTLKIKTEMDLRKTGEDMLGDTVTHKYYNSSMYKYIFDSDAVISTKNIFSDLANPANYPVYMHCTYGSDRTGTVCFILEALLGMSKNDIIKEYQLSAFCYDDFSLNEIKEFIAEFETLEGETYTEKAENYLLSIGVTEKQIESIRNIFLG